MRPFHAADESATRKSGCINLHVALRLKVFTDYLATYHLIIGQVSLIAVTVCCDERPLFQTSPIDLRALVWAKVGRAEVRAVGSTARREAKQLRQVWAKKWEQGSVSGLRRKQRVVRKEGSQQWEMQVLLRRRTLLLRDLTVLLRVPHPKGRWRATKVWVAWEASGLLISHTRSSGCH